VLVTAIFAPLATIAILMLLRMLMGDLRVGAEAEFVGLDLSEHSESAYVFGTTSGTPASHGASSFSSEAVGHGEARQSTA
jgi:hypothetical protein